MVFCMICQRDFYGISMGFRMDFYGVPMVFPDMSMVFLWDYSRTAMESKLKPIEKQLKVN